MFLMTKQRVFLAADLTASGLSPWFSAWPSIRVDGFRAATYDWHVGH